MVIYVAMHLMSEATRTNLTLKFEAVDNILAYQSSFAYGTGKTGITLG